MAAPKFGKNTSPKSATSGGKVMKSAAKKMADKPMKKITAKKK